MTRFWIAMLHGAKLWRLIPPSEYWRAGPSYNPDLEYYPGIFTADIINPNFTTYPNLDGALVYEAILRPGDVLFSPASWAHQVVNVQDSVMTGMNYYDNEAIGPALQYADYTDDDTIDTDTLQEFFIPLDIPEYDDDDDHYDGNNKNMDMDMTLNEYIQAQHLQRAKVPGHVQDWIDSYPEDVLEYRSPSTGLPALFVAVSYNFLNLVRYLLEECDGLNVNDVIIYEKFSDKDEITALDLAILLGYKDTAQVLMKFGGLTSKDLKV